MWVASGASQRSFLRLSCRVSCCIWVWPFWACIQLFLSMQWNTKIFTFSQQKKESKTLLSIYPILWDPKTKLANGGCRHAYRLLLRPSGVCSQVRSFSATCTGVAVTFRETRGLARAYRPWRWGSSPSSVSRVIPVLHCHDMMPAG
jgi:hypothetical protein